MAMKIALKWENSIKRVNGLIKWVTSYSNLSWVPVCVEIWKGERENGRNSA